jgi:hypothetical protein
MNDGPLNTDRAPPPWITYLQGPSTSFRKNAEDVPRAKTGYSEN